MLKYVKTNLGFYLSDENKVQFYIESNFCKGIIKMLIKIRKIKRLIDFLQSKGRIGK